MQRVWPVASLPPSSQPFWTPGLASGPGTSALTQGGPRGPYVSPFPSKPLPPTPPELVTLDLLAPQETVHIRTVTTGREAQASSRSEGLWGQAPCVHAGDCPRRPRLSPA